MSLPKVNLVVVGHKDHGKSTLVGRLLYDSKAIPEQKLAEIREELKSAGKEFEFAFILDSLEEERAGGLTIDIMHTPFKSRKYFYTIIDCPGHKEFIQKMLTGASEADAAILVVSAKEGIEDQTREHLFLIKTLGIGQLTVAVNKMDMIGYDQKTFRRFSRAVKELLSSIGYLDVPVVPVSAFMGDNVTTRSGKMKWHKGGTLIETLDQTVKPQKPLSEKPLRCVVQDTYDLEGENVVVCKVETGTLQTGQSVLVMPIGEKGIVQKIESFGEEAREAVAGDSIGIILKGVSGVERGHVLSSAKERLDPTKEFIAELIVFEDLTLRVGDTVVVRIGTAETACRLQKILGKIDAVKLTVVEEKPESLESREVGKMLFTALDPLYVETYSDFPQLGRFVIIGRKGATAAGIVLEKN
ncbi:MAG: GTP-binding protein [Candidatus Bathyarchaeota archaeon]|nr:GTP-binding protein [Candidatus Bathyarchaeota archaeon]